MARTPSRLTAGTVILDSEGLSKGRLADRRVIAYVREAQSNDFRVVVSALSAIEAFDMRVENERFR
ncbi:hypothetical protein ACWEKT_09820 [Nocardia takedensis]